MTHESEYSVNLVKQFGDKTIALRSVAANQDHGIVEIYGRKGKLVSSFEVDNNITERVSNNIEQKVDNNAHEEADELKR